MGIKQNRIEQLGSVRSQVGAAKPLGIANIPTDIMARAKDIVAAHRPEGIPVGAEPLNAKILVVEDDELWADVHTSQAKDEGHEVVTASSAEEAQRIIDEGGIDFIVTDGLDDTWTIVDDAAKRQGIGTLVVSSSWSVEKEAKARKVPIIGKLDGWRGKTKEIYKRLPK